MFKRKFKHLALTASIAALLCPSAQAASTITIFASPAVANVVADLISDFISVTNDIVDPVTGKTGLGYSVSLQVSSDDAEEADIIAAGANAGAGLPDLFLSQSITAPNDLWLNHTALAAEAPFVFAKDSLVLYSSADKQANIKTSISTNGTLDNKKLLASLLKFSIPDPATNDPYGLAAKKVLGAFYPLLGKLMVKVPDTVGSYASVAVIANADGGTDFGFTGLSQICTALDGTRRFEPGAKQYIFPSTSDIQLAGVKIVNDYNQANTAQYQELTDFVNFLKGTALATGAKTGKDTLAQHCYH